MNKKLIVPSVAGIAAVAGIAGGLGLGALGASTFAATTTGTTSTTGTSSTSTSTTAADTDTQDTSKGGHTANGITEALLTGDTLTKATDAAKAAVPGATVERAENDAEGATYEVHMKKTDGSEVTVKLDSSFKVTSTVTGRG